MTKPGTVAPKASPLHSNREDYVIPIVFPDYLIAVTVSRRRVDLLPGVKWDDFEIGFKAKMPELGHAGVLMIDGTTGLTRYYEYGRYDPKQRGWARTLRIDDAKLENGVINWNSLKRPLHQVSRGAGHGGRIEAVLIALKAGFAAMEKYARSRVAENRHPKRKPYDNTSNNSVHFSKNVAEAGGAKTPWMLDPRPNSYIGEFQSSYPFIRYDPKSHKLSINGIGDF